VTDEQHRLVIGYEQLIIGTGAVPAEPPIERLDLPGVHLLHTMGNAFADPAGRTRLGGREGAQRH
jgi:NADPH-dependent 2,4-dienoyl-CoA reductase/sulfur reductase-like enzyme